MNKISEIDITNFEKIRANVSSFLEECSIIYDNLGRRLLDVAPQDYAGAKEYFVKSDISTLDIDPKSGADYIADLCKNNKNLIPDDYFDFVVCTEVLEHVRNPFDAVKEIKRVLSPGGIAFVSSPFNFRIHGPLPDCWRFTKHGLEVLFSDFSLTHIREMRDPDRFLMPIHHTVIARK